MNESVGNLELLIKKEALSSYYGFNDVMVKLISLIRPIKNYESKSTGIGPHHIVKFEKISLGLYKVEASCKGYLNKNDFVHVKLPNKDTKHFQKARNRKYLKIKKESGYSLSEKGANLLKSIEKLEAKPYDDQTGKETKIWVKGATIGYGQCLRRSVGF